MVAARLFSNSLSRGFRFGGGACGFTMSAGNVLAVRGGAINYRAAIYNLVPGGFVWVSSAVLRCFIMRGLTRVRGKTAGNKSS